MKKVGIILLNYFPAVLTLFIFRYHIDKWFLFIVYHVALVLLNFLLSDKISEMILYSVNLLVSTFITHAASTLLHYHFISDDAETILVGEFALFVGLIFVFTLSLIFILIKALVLKLRKKNKTE